jgi:uncharacterized protein YqjF (DUF2071 family)
MPLDSLSAARTLDWLARHVGRLSTFMVASVWLVHGLLNKLLHFSPRHLQIVQSVPGLAGSRGELVLTAVGLCEVGIALWVLTGWAAGACAAVQTIFLLSMNAVELSVARPLLLWPAGLIPINLAFLGVAWVAATSRGSATALTRLRRHPIAVKAHFRHCLTLTYALPPDVLRPLLAPGLELDTYDGYAFVAVALVQTESLRPAILPAALGQDFFLAGYRIFTLFTPPGGKAMRGLRILRSDADRSGMVVGGNLLTHYNYHRCNASVDTASDRIHFSVRTADGLGALEVTADRSSDTLPVGSPFWSVRDARRFAGPLLFTFDYERETDSIIAIRATRTHWQPAPVSVDVGRISFFAQPPFNRCTPTLAAAFYVHDVDYRWERGVRYALGGRKE